MYILYTCTHIIIGYIYIYEYNIAYCIYISYDSRVVSMFFSIILV